MQITLYIELEAYTQNKNIIDKYIISHKKIEVIGTGCLICLIVIVITPSNLSELLDKIGVAINIQYYIFRDDANNIMEKFYPYRFLLDVFEYIDDVSQLTQTVLKVYENDDEFKNHPVVHEARIYVDILGSAFIAKDKNVWKSIILPTNTDMRTYTHLLNYIFKAANNDSHVDALVKYLDIIDRVHDEKTDRWHGELFDDDHDNLSNCVFNSIINNCPKMRKRFINSRLFSYTTVNITYFMEAVADEQFETADELLELMDQNDLFLKMDIFICSRLSLQSVMYLFDLIVNDRITIPDDKLYGIIDDCIESDNISMFAYVLTYYSHHINRSTLEIFNYRTPNEYVKELEKLVRINEELMKELN